MLTPVHNPSKGKLRVIGYASGSGNTFFEVYVLQKRMESSPYGCPFEVVGIFADKLDDPAAFRKAVQPVYDMMVKELGEEAQGYFDRIEAIAP